MKKIITTFFLFISFTISSQSSRTNSTELQTKIKYPLKEKNKNNHQVHPRKRLNQHFNKTKRGLDFHRKTRRAGKFVKNIFKASNFYADEKFLQLGTSLNVDAPIKKIMPDMNPYISREIYVGVKPIGKIPAWFMINWNGGNYADKFEDGKYNSSDGTAIDVHNRFRGDYTKILVGIRLEKPGKICPYLSFQAGRIHFSSDLEIYRSNANGSLNTDKHHLIYEAEVQSGSSYIWMAGTGAAFYFERNCHLDLNVSYIGGPQTSYMNLEKAENYSGTAIHPGQTIISPSNLSQQKIAEIYKTKMGMLSFSLRLGWWF